MLADAGGTEDGLGKKADAVAIAVPECRQRWVPQGLLRLVQLYQASAGKRSWLLWGKPVMLRGVDVSGAHTLWWPPLPS